MIKQVYIDKDGQTWLLPISAWIGVCKDGARDAGYAFPDDCLVTDGRTIDPDIMLLKIDNWMPVDFKDFIAAYERGDIKPTKPEPVVPKKVDPLVNPQDHWVDTKPVIIEAPAKKPRGKKK